MGDYRENKIHPDHRAIMDEVARKRHEDGAKENAAATQKADEAEKSGIPIPGTDIRLVKTRGHEGN